MIRIIFILTLLCFALTAYAQPAPGPKVPAIHFQPHVNASEAGTPDPPTDCNANNVGMVHYSETNMERGLSGDDIVRSLKICQGWPRLGTPTRFLWSSIHEPVEVVRSPEEFEAVMSAATRANKIIQLTSGNALWEQNTVGSGSGGVNSGCASCGAGGVAEVVLDDTQSTNPVTAGNIMLFISGGASDPPEGEWCEISAIRDDDPTPSETTLVCDRALSAAPTVTSTVTVDNPVQLELGSWVGPPGGFSEGVGVVILCEQGAGFGQNYSGSSPSVALTISVTDSPGDGNPFVSLVGCVIAGRRAGSNDFEKAIILTDSTVDYRLYLQDVRTQSLYDGDDPGAGGIPGINGDVFLTVDDPHADITIHDSHIQAVLPFHFQTAPRGLKIFDSEIGNLINVVPGPSNPGHNHTCIWSGDFFGNLSTFPALGVFALNTNWRICAPFHMGSGSGRMRLSGSWQWPNYWGGNNGLPGGEGFVSMEAGDLELDIDIKQTNFGTPFFIYGDPNQPLIHQRAGTGVLNIWGSARDPDCLVSNLDATAPRPFLIRDGSSTMALGTSIVMDETGGVDTFTRTVGSWITEGFLDTETFVLENSATQDGTYTISGSPTATVLTVVEPITDEAAQTDLIIFTDRSGTIETVNFDYLQGPGCADLASSPAFDPISEAVGHGLSSTAAIHITTRDSSFVQYGVDPVELSVQRGDNQIRVEESAPIVAFNLNNDITPPGIPVSDVKWSTIVDATTGETGVFGDIVEGDRTGNDIGEESWHNIDSGVSACTDTTATYGDHCYDITLRRNYTCPLSGGCAATGWEKTDAQVSLDGNPVGTSLFEDPDFRSDGTSDIDWTEGASQAITGTIHEATAGRGELKWHHSHATDCQAVTGGTALDTCYEFTTGTLWTCPLGGDCSGVDPWVKAGSQPQQGASPPAFCEVGQVFVDTDETVDTNCDTIGDNALCLCTAADTWTPMENPLNVPSVVVKTAAEFETAINVTATGNMRIVIPSGLMLNHPDPVPSSTATGGTATGGPLGVGTIIDTEADVIGVQVGDVIIIDDSVDAAEPFMGEYCVIAAINDLGATNEFECEQPLSGAADSDTVIAISRPIFIDGGNIVPNDDFGIGIDCEQGAGFGLFTGSDPHVVMRIDNGPHDTTFTFNNCRFAGADATPHDIGVLFTNQPATVYRAYFINTHTQGIINIETAAGCSSKNCHPFVRGDRWMVSDVTNINHPHIHMLGGQHIDVGLVFQNMTDSGTRFEFKQGLGGTSRPILTGEENLCVYYDDYLDTATARSFQFQWDAIAHQCRGFHLGQNTNARIAGQWSLPSTFSLDVLPQGGWIAMDGGTLQLDVEILAGGASDPEEPLIFVLEGLSQEIDIQGQVVDRLCLISDTTATNAIIDAHASSGVIANVDLSYIQGADCRASVPVFSANAVAAFLANSTANVRTRDEWISHRGTGTPQRRPLEHHDSEVIYTVAEFEAAVTAATGTKRIIIPDGVFLSNVNPVDDTDGINADCTSGCSTTQLVDTEGILGTVASPNVVVGDYILVWGGAASGPNAGEHCEISAVSADDTPSAGLKTLTCDKTMTGAFSSSTDYVVTRPVKAIMTNMVQDSFEKITVLCEGGAGFGSQADGDGPKLALTIENPTARNAGLVLDGCALHGETASDFDMGILATDTGAGKIYDITITGMTTDGFDDSSACGAAVECDPYVQGDVWFTNDDDSQNLANLRLEVADSNIDAANHYHIMRQVTMNVHNTSHGFFVAVVLEDFDGSNWSCIHAKEWDGTASAILGKFHDMTFSTCKTLYLGDGSSVQFDNVKLAGMSALDATALPGGGWIEFDNGDFQFDFLVTGDTSSPTEPLFFIEDGTGDTRLHGDITDEDCQLSRTSGTQPLINAGSSAGDIEQVFIDFRQGQTCQSGANFNLISAIADNHLTATSEVHSFTRDEEIRHSGTGVPLEVMRGTEDHLLAWFAVGDAIGLTAGNCAVAGSVGEADVSCTDTIGRAQWYTTRDMVVTKIGVTVSLPTWTDDEACDGSLEDDGSLVGAIFDIGDAPLNLSGEHELQVAVDTVVASGSALTFALDNPTTEFCEGPSSPCICTGATGSLIGHVYGHYTE